ncbi:hypothetical protein [Sphingobium sp. UBA5915]|uniref:hypothetical protein n=1 Tax=Sphingobium sp. UBA5915 TaxID=1947530 RepID=UPI0025DC67D8|nr:hypothetical protein [Sphingobium sp. UBA5915]
MAHNKPCGDVLLHESERVALPDTMSEPLRPYDSHTALTEMLSDQRSKAWDIALHEREQSDKITAQVRFGLVAANAASLVTAWNIGKDMPGVDAASLAWSCVAFLAGTVSAGLSLVSQQNGILVKAAELDARAQTLDTAVTLSKHPARSKEYQALEETMARAHDHLEEALKVRSGPIWLQNAAMGSWLAGALMIAMPALAAASPSVKTALTFVGFEVTNTAPRRAETAPTTRHR